MSVLLATVVAQAAQPALVIGTYQKGNNVTEPRPKKSEYFETLHGGIVVVGDNAGYYLFTKVIKKPEKDLYIVVEYENPSGGMKWTPKVGQRGTVSINQKGTVQHVQETTPA